MSPARLRNACAQFLSPVSVSTDLFLDLSELVDEGSLEWIALSIHGFRIPDLKAVVLDARLRALSVEELFSVCAVKVEPFATLPQFRDAPILLHVDRGHCIVK